jgi:hypothetical protein
VRTRTYLTTPPGREPTDATGRAEDDRERYVRALDLPTEPRVPGKHRRLLIVLSVIAVLSLVGLLLLRMVSASQSEDPAMTDPSMQQVPEGAPEGGADDGEGPSLRG